jgi:glycosyltransferase 2 family protein
VNYKQTLRYIIALAVVIAAGYFFYLQFKRNADAISAYHFQINPYYIIIAVMIGSCALFMGPVVWRIFVNHYLREKLSFSESFALYCTSAMFKYIPGKIWTYAAQIALMSPKGISSVVLLYINFVCFICLAFAATMFALYYYLFCLQALPPGISVLIFIVLIIADIIFIVWNNDVINHLIIPVNRMFKVAIQPIKTGRIIFVYTQILYMAAFIFLGVAMYFLAKGLNMEIPFYNMFAIMAAISVSGVLGLIAFFSVGGLGVREGAMFFMLKQFSTVEAALILPIAARLLLTIVELLMGITGLMMGMKYGYFPKPAKSPQKEIIESSN